MRYLFAFGLASLLATSAHAIGYGGGCPGGSAGGLLGHNECVQNQSNGSTSGGTAYAYSYSRCVKNSSGLYELQNIGANTYNMCKYCSNVPGCSGGITAQGSGASLGGGAKPRPGQGSGSAANLGGKPGKASGSRTP